MDLEAESLPNAIWSYQVFPDDTNYQQRDDKINNFISHDPNQSLAIEAEYQWALQTKQLTHSFLLSGNFEKCRNHYEYAIVFEDILNKHSWYKTNIKSFRIRLLKRVVIEEKKKVNDIEEQKCRIDEIINRFP